MIRLEKLCKSYGTKILLDNVSFQFPLLKKIALVGDNGAGKSTLLNLICGLETPDSGQILIPAQFTIGYIPQEANPAPLPTILEECESGMKHLLALKTSMERALAAMETSEDANTLAEFETAETAFRLGGGYRLSAQAAEILLGLGFAQEQLTNSPLTLSGGWRMRLEIAKLLLRAPSFLVLDEPTNHLDLPSLVWVESYLKNYRGTLLFVSHDRALLDRLPEWTLHLQDGVLTPYPGNYTKFLETKELKEKQAEAAFNKIQRKQEQLETFISRFGAKATKAAQAQSKAKVVAKLEEEKATLNLAGKSRGIRFQLPEAPASNQILLKVEHAAIGYARPLVKELNLQITRGQKIAVIGANGIGKTTLLKTVMGKISPLAGEIIPTPRTILAYFAQERLAEFNPDESVLDNMLRITGMAQNEARKILGGFLFSGEDAFKLVKYLSGGEKSRLGLACLLGQKANLLLLDEPTNHLDMESIECLVGALQSYTGTVLFVSHDRDFINRICTHVFVVIKDGSNMLFEGDLGDYSRLARVAGFPDIQNVEVVTDPAAASLSDDGQPRQDLDRDAQKRKRRLQKRLESLDTEIVAINREIDVMNDRLTDMASSNYSALIEQNELLMEKRHQLKELEDEWIQVSEEFEQFKT